MGKGGESSQMRAAPAPETNLAPMKQQFDKDGHWKSLYDPLAEDAPELPTKGAIKRAIPDECFHRSYFWSMYYLVQDSVIAAAFVYATTLCLSTDLPSIWNPLECLVWTLGWTFYAFWMGTILTGPWVIAHECGHGAFSPSQTWNDIVGFIVHQALLVPYFAWQYTHAKHHRRTNHLTDGESHVPSTAAENGLGPNNERESFYAILHEAMGDGCFAGFQVWSHLAIGWPLYLMGFASTGKLDCKGRPLAGRIADHFRWSENPMFPEKVSFKIFMSTAGVVLQLAFLAYLMLPSNYGIVPVTLWYFNPYFVSNAWLVLYTWLQHTDPSVPQYGEGEWTWVRGALTTIDRPYGIFDFFHHRIGSTHVAHHFFHEIPHYNALKATRALENFLGAKGLYNYDPTPVWKVMWRVGKTCHYVQDVDGIQYYKSMEDIPLTKDVKEKTN